MTERMLERGMSVNAPPGAAAAAADAAGAPTAGPVVALERSAAVTEPNSPDPVPTD